MFCEKVGEADCFFANVFTHELIAARCFVTFVEEQIQRLQDAVESPSQLRTGGNLKRNFRVANLLFGARQTFGNGSFSREKGAADFRHAETAKRVQRQRGMS